MFWLVFFHLTYVIGKTSVKQSHVEMKKQVAKDREDLDKKLEDLHKKVHANELTMKKLELEEASQQSTGI